MGSKALDSVITPLHIEIALQYSKAQSGEAASRVSDNDVVAQICHQFADAGLLEIADDNQNWKATDAMHQYIESLCRVPLPESMGLQPDLISHLETVLSTKSRSVGDESPDEDEKIAAVLDEYVAVVPRVRI